MRSSKYVITAGPLFNDIDAIACAFAYQQFLKIKNIDTEVVLEGTLNTSITPDIKKLLPYFRTKILKKDIESNIIIVDSSDTQYLDKFIKTYKVIEIFDHRFGFENFWKEKLGEKSHIEEVGACATLIWEEFAKANITKSISETNAKLIAYAIISNTLNLKAQITSKRDSIALSQVVELANLSQNWEEEYFKQYSVSVFEDPRSAMINDTKVIKVNNISWGIVQCELWNSVEFINKNMHLILEILSNLPSDYSFFTSPSILDGINFIVTNNPSIKKILNSKFSIEFEGDIGKSKNLILRKEIFKGLVKTT